MSCLQIQLSFNYILSTCLVYSCNWHVWVTQETTWQYSHECSVDPCYQCSRTCSCRFGSWFPWNVNTPSSVHTWHDHLCGSSSIPEGVSFCGRRQFGSPSKYLQLSKGVGVIMESWLTRHVYYFLWDDTTFQGRRSGPWQHFYLLVWWLGWDTDHGRGCGPCKNQSFVQDNLYVGCNSKTSEKQYA